MTAFLAMIRKLITDSRWMLGLSFLALFGLSWVFVYVAGRIERRMSAVAEVAGENRPRILERFGGPDMDDSSAAIEVMFWNHPFIFLIVGVWAVGRGSSAVAGEIERGTLDLVLSRPISRPFFLGTNVLFSTLGLLVLALAMIVGNQVGGHYNHVQSPPSISVLVGPSLNLAALGLAMYGYTVLFSALDSVRWRATLGGSFLSLAGFILHVVVNLPTLEEWKPLDRFSIFKAYNPVELVTKGETLVYNVGLLGLVGAAGIGLAFLVFSYRDLPANS